MGVADKVRVSSVSECNTTLKPSRVLKGHFSSVTCVELSEDNSIAYSGSKDGDLIWWDIENKIHNRMNNNDDSIENLFQWNKSHFEMIERNKSLLALITTSDGLLIATGGKDHTVRIYDSRIMKQVINFPGHKETITGLIFRESTHELFSCSMDRTVKIWSLNEQAYVDSLFGHQEAILCLDCRRAERPVTGGFDQSCRLWKIAQESQLVFRAHSNAIESCGIITGSQWVTGDQDGYVCLWSTAKKKPISIVSLKTTSLPQFGMGSIREACKGWVFSLAVCKGTDLIAAGLGDGVVRFIKHNQNSSRHQDYFLTIMGGIPLRGYVNGLKVAKSARFFLAGVGQEPKHGRWAYDKGAKNGIVIQPIEI